MHEYRRNDKEEEDEHFSRDHDPEFVRKQLMRAVDTGSLEKRINSNRHNIQRGGRHMDENNWKK